MVDKEFSGADERGSLFRRQAVNASDFQIFSSVSVCTPPSLVLSLVIALGTLVALSVLFFIIEIPERTIAGGVLMPAGGLTEIIAEADGRVISVLMKPGQTVSAGTELLVVQSGEGAVAGGRQSDQTLASLQAEMNLRQQEFAARQLEARERIAAAKESLAAAEEQHRLGSAQLAIQQQRGVFMQARFERRERLSVHGHLATDLIDLERNDLLLQRANIVALQQEVATQFAEVHQLRRDIAARQHALDSLRADFRISRERLQRQLTQTEAASDGRYRAPVDAVVAHALTRAGNTIRRGQVLAKLHARDAEIEAWIYVATTDARYLQLGQNVEIRISAFPLEIFGTISASITSISSVALLPEELQVPLQLRGPVFEVRARFDSVQLQKNELAQRLQPGLPFRADIINAKYKMYLWLLRSLRASAAQTEFISHA